MQRLNQIQDDLNYEMSRQFIGKQGTVYNKLKELTNVPSQVELNQLLQNKIEVNTNAKTRNIDGINGA